ncbi:lipoprotein-releasing system permease protein [Winogradskyella wandonensis]|uniref:Lipoprotein-releasing system permease protein n=1 Tax=Winogradskyella wandonensis TaxID=1442586 RepID=A0A4R1KS66_9FLAO|nr:FtsX-like permease family protein [Winogradskyella wandonensis]TCK67874.1 lipoprotein-releasing system permease protein [Winogradskyella wandonensis]
MNTSFYIAKRYLFSRSSNNAINIMSYIASGGVIVASAALLIVLSVFAGLKEFSLDFSNYTDPDLKLLPLEGKSFFFSEKELNTLTSIEGVALFSKILEERVVIKSENKNLLATLKGVDDNYRVVTKIDSMISQGEWISSGSNEVVSGWGISNNLSFGIFNYLKPLTIYVPKPGKGQGSSLRSYFNSEVVTNVGLFNINEKIDNEYVFADIELARALLNYTPNQFSSIEVKLKPEADETEVKEQIEKLFPNTFIIKNREQLNDALFKMLNTENLAVYLIFTLVIIIALFNVIGAIIMMILDRKKSLNTLFNLGAEPKLIKSIFFLQGTLMTVLSGLIGIGIGLLIIFSQLQFEWIMLTSDFPYPVSLKLENIVIVVITIFGLGIIASKLASQRITKDLIKTVA